MGPQPARRKPMARKSLLLITEYKDFQNTRKMGKEGLWPELKAKFYKQISSAQGGNTTKVLLIDAKEGQPGAIPAPKHQDGMNMTLLMVPSSRRTELEKLCSSAPGDLAYAKISRRLDVEILRTTKSTGQQKQITALQLGTKKVSNKSQTKKTPKKEKKKEKVPAQASPDA